MEKSESLDNESDESCSVHFRYFFFLLRLMIFHSLYFLSLDESDSLDDESDKLGSDSGSSGTYSSRAFSLRAEESVVGVLGSGVFAPIGVNSVAGIFASD